MKIAILGGGVTGLTAAYHLLKRGEEVLLIEKENEVGGILRSTKVNDTLIENYYHHVFPNNKALFEILKELELYKDLQKVNATTGFYHKQKLYELSTPFDLLSFKPLSFVDKLKLARLMLKIKTIKDPSKCSKKPMKDWIIKNSNKSVYKNFFRPLLRSKYGKNLKEISLPWFIERMKLRSNRGFKGEKLLYLRGGFGRFIKKLKREIQNKGGRILLNTKPSNIEIKDGGVSNITYNSKKEEIDAIISTIPPKSLNNALGSKVIFEPEYQGSICILMGLKKSLCDLYWTNIIKGGISFGAYIEHTNIQPKSLYGGQTISYLASYPEFSSEIWEKEDKEIFERYFSDLKKLFDVKKEDLNFWKVFKTRKAGIIYKRGIDPRVMECKTEIPNLFIGGMFNSYPKRSINLSVKLGKRCVDKISSI